MLELISFLIIVIAQTAEVFKEELSPVKIMHKKKESIVDVDEHPKPQTTLEMLSKLPSVFKKDGVVTAGTASVSIFFLTFIKIHVEI